MSISEYWQVIIGVLGSIGTGGAIIWAFSSCLGKVWANRIMQKEIHDYKRELQDEAARHNTELEGIKAKYSESLSKVNAMLEKKNYVSKVRFDAEFAIYQELCGKIFDLLSKSYLLFPFLDKIHPDPEEQEKIKQKRYNDAVESYNTVRHILGKSSPFIEADVYLRFNKLYIDCGKLIEFFPDEYRKELDKDTRKEMREIAMNLKDRYDTIISDLRDYLKNLEVID